MFDFVYRHKRALQLILALLIIPPFALFGVDSYLRERSGTATVATVNGQNIAQQEFNIALRERQEQLQQMTGGKMDAAMLDSPELRFGVADALVNQQLLLQHASRSKLVAADQQLQSLLSQAPAFQDNGKFSLEAYQNFLKTRNKTAAEFENELRRDFILQQVNDPYAGSAFMPRTVVQRVLNITETQREASVHVLAPAAYESKVSVDADAAKKYYDSRKDEFRTPEQVRAEYVVFTIDALLPEEKVDPEAVRTAYDEQLKKNPAQETRQASHILIAVDEKAPAAEKQKARAKAEELLKQVKAKPQAFAEIAKANSQDPGSAANGGDLGAFKRSDMVKPFSDAAFGMKVGEISNLVESNFGFHIIKLTGMTESKAPTFESRRAEIETELKRQAASRKFAGMSEQFNNIVYEQFDNLKAAAEFAKTTVLQSGWVSRGGGASDPRLNNPKLLQALFSDEVMKNKRNTEVVEVGPGTLIAARLLEHKPSVVRTFEESQASIVATLTRQRAAQLAAQEGRALLDKLRKGEDAGFKWGDAKLVAFSNPVQGLDEETRKQILRVDVSKLPAYAGMETPGGYALIRVSRVVAPEKADPEKEKNIAAAIQQAHAQEQNSVFLASLKQRGSINIRKDQVVEKKEK